MKPFVAQNSIVRQIWGKADTILFIFAGAAAEFSLNKAVDWLYFTGKLPKDPLGRLFSTVAYSKEIIFSEESDALSAIDEITIIHKNVENSRGSQIPDWAYRDVLYMLIQYSITAFELLERKLSEKEKEEIYKVFWKVGNRMNLVDLPKNYDKWLIERSLHLENNLCKSEFTVDLYRQYRHHLGWLRYFFLLEGQKIILPIEVKKKLNLSSISLIEPIISIYKITRRIKLDKSIVELLLPRKFKLQMKMLQ